MYKKILPALLIVGFVLFSFIPTFYEYINRYKTKPIRHFELVHNFPTDYNLYLSKIRQGKEGAWLAKEKYTSEPHEGSLSQILYVFIGRVSDWVKIQTPYIWFSYHVMRFFFAVLLLFVVWQIVRWVFPVFSWQIVAFLLVVTASTWPKFETVDGWPRFGGFMPWYTMVDSLQRTTFMPHVLFGQAMLAFILWVFAGGFLSKKHPANYLFLGVVGIVMGIIFPPALFFVYGVLALLTTIEFGALLVQIRQRKELKKAVIRWAKESFFGRAVFGFMTLPTMLYYSLLFTQYPWKRLVEFDVINPTKFSYIEYFLALGPTLLFGLFGMIAVLLTRKHPIAQKLPVFLTWGTAWLFFIFVFNFIPQQSPTRFSQVLPHLPLGILTAYLFYVLSGVFRKMSSSALEKLAKEQPKTEEQTDTFEIRGSIYQYLLYASILLPLPMILLGLGTMTSSWLWQKDFVDHKLRADIPFVPTGAQVMYPLKDLAEAMVWLQNYTPRDAVVFSAKATGNMIPVYAGNTTHIGHANTVDSETKEIVVANFYDRRVPLAVVEEYFKRHKIAYVLYGPEEAEIAKGVKDLRVFYPWLTEVYKNTYVTLYKVNL